jgi:hypothetical protein
MLPSALVKKFPKLLADGAEKTSEPTKQYNCIAWSAARDREQWWQPIKEEPWDYWPSDIPVDCSLESFVMLFEKRGYHKCSGSQFEFFYQKVAIYADVDAFTHVCDQLNSGAWSSKLAAYEDIRHNSLEALEGSVQNEYGQVKQILKRRCGLVDITIRTFLKVAPALKKYCKRR